MALRVRLVMTWTIRLVTGYEKAPFSKISDFEELAKAHLVSAFHNYNAALTIAVKEDYGSIATLELVWDVDLDGVKGGYHNPEDHVALAKRELVEEISGYGRKLDVQVFRHADFEEATDHGEIMSAAIKAGKNTRDAEYPIFRPELDADWPEATVVWLQDGAWYWHQPSTKRTEAVGPAVGDKPVAIFAAWDPEYREKRYQKFLESAA